MNTIFNEVMQKRNSKVLDVGFGTGVFKLLGIDMIRL
ncbi:hypothetical protein SAMN05216238_11257 [Lentibacillus persicus]|uniref:Uncharacterized protein n=1 Tax=Lentibacillus persicus TaxID=640948 RepID=A0A1I1ZDZ6_9BACI|nr:hypothetical protein SAMN05216238_11257 [Lentibacillus persicus]